MAHEFSLSEFPNDGIKVTGKVGGVSVAYLLADSGAIICVVAESLVPERVAWREEEV